MNERDRLIHNERAKLVAMYLNGMAIAFAVSGAVTIPLTISVSVSLPGNVRCILAGVMLTWFGASTLLHRWALRLLTRLEV